jgi:hypothetical protein
LGSDGLMIDGDIDNIIQREEGRTVKPNSN